MAICPRDGEAFMGRQRKWWSRSSSVGALKLETQTPCGLTPDMTCLIVPSLPAASIAWKMMMTEYCLLAQRRS